MRNGLPGCGGFGLLYFVANIFVVFLFRQYSLLCFIMGNFGMRSSIANGESTSVADYVKSCYGASCNTPSSPSHMGSLLWFFLRREPYYHKLQYSKTPKFDVAAAVLGAVISAFVGYLTLSSLGSAGADLTDMIIIFWYIFLVYRCLLLIIFLGRDSIGFFFNVPMCFVRVLVWMVVRK